MFVLALQPEKNLLVMLVRQNHPKMPMCTG
ncbi:hypothetical protein PENANT_c003G01939 [Penicillium antarcticum]|uniref:Uncharacterized protein n=1 Tax=Penicillium antarcticum TaxID=416450 RepID=A0A1V6QHH8_9EURO|nr:hypothetical protein PENANT_c003G01939 [Penicillium antarcticum]